MFCPECRSEYITGVGFCDACGIPLVAELPTVPPPEFVEYEEILSTPNPGEIALIKSLLEEAGIDFRFFAEVAGPPLALPARLLVPKDRGEEAKEILDRFMKADRAVAGEEPGDGDE